MTSSERGPKSFKEGTEIIPLNLPGISTLSVFQSHEQEIQHLEYLKRCGLTDDEIQLYHEAQRGTERNKMEKFALRDKLKYIYSKLNATNPHQHSCAAQAFEDATPSTSAEVNGVCSTTPPYYPHNHPMNSIQELEKDLFDHIRFDEIAPITKRRKMLRRMHRKEQAWEYDGSKISVNDLSVISPNTRSTSLWDVREVAKISHGRSVDNSEKKQKTDIERTAECNKRLIGPTNQTHYTIRDNKIVRLEPVNGGDTREYRAVDISSPKNRAEQRLLEGTKFSVDQIRSIERFKDYHPGQPSKVLFLKNISTAAQQNDISILFNQYAHINGSPVGVRLGSGRLRGQAFVQFHSENVAIQALEDVNGTVVKGRPIIAQFGKRANNSYDC